MITDVTMNGGNDIMTIIKIIKKNDENNIVIL